MAASLSHPSCSGTDHLYLFEPVVALAAHRRHRSLGPRPPTVPARDSLSSRRPPLPLGPAGAPHHRGVSRHLGASGPSPRGGPEDGTNSRMGADTQPAPPRTPGKPPHLRPPAPGSGPSRPAGPPRPSPARATPASPRSSRSARGPPGTRCPRPAPLPTPPCAARPLGLASAPERQGFLGLGRGRPRQPAGELRSSLPQTASPVYDAAMSASGCERPCSGLLLHPLQLPVGRCIPGVNEEVWPPRLPCPFSISEP